MSTQQPRCYLLIGPPCAGKSTWRTKYLAVNAAPIVISSDDYFDDYAAAHGLTYSAAMREIGFKEITTILKGRLRVAVANRADIVVDRTNMSKKIRSKTLMNLSSDYRKIGVVFRYDLPTILERAARRGAETGKHVPVDVIEDMIKRYEEPTSGEFHEIITI